jgi:hypothetical protein
MKKMKDAKHRALAEALELWVGQLNAKDLTARMRLLTLWC